MKNVLSNWNDIRQITYKERINIGYKNVRNFWQTAPAHYTPNALKICGHPVMEDWEKGYMKLLAKIATQTGGNILEVGFGMGISASNIQNYKISKHTIIEANQAVYDKATAWRFRATAPVELLFGFWENITKNLSNNSFNGILFDTYPLTEAEIHKNHFSFFKEAYRLLKPGGILTYYSDEISDFSYEHRALIKTAGFSSIDKIICPVSPPPDCQYWKSATILAPIVTK